MSPSFSLHAIPGSPFAFSGCCPSWLLFLPSPTLALFCCDVAPLVFPPGTGPEMPGPRPGGRRALREDVRLGASLPQPAMLPGSLAEQWPFLPALGTARSCCWPCVVSPHGHSAVGPGASAGQLMHHAQALPLPRFKSSREIPTWGLFKSAGPLLSCPFGPLLWAVLPVASPWARVDVPLCTPLVRSFLFLLRPSLWGVSAGPCPGGGS